MIRTKKRTASNRTRQSKSKTKRYKRPPERQILPPEELAELRRKVNAEWMQIRNALCRQLRLRRVPQSQMEDAIAEAAGKLWVNLMRGFGVGQSIWRAAADVARADRFILKRDYAGLLGCEPQEFTPRPCFDRLRAVTAQEPIRIKPCACCGERMAAAGDTCNRCRPADAA